MITQAVLSSRAGGLTLFKKDSPRPIDRVIDYFGDGPPPAATSSGSAGDDPVKEGDRVVLDADTPR